MANFFDQFDPAPADQPSQQQSTEGNFFDQFDQQQDNSIAIRDPSGVAPGRVQPGAAVTGPKVDRGWLNNASRNFGERAGEVSGNLLQFIGNVAVIGEKYLTEDLNLPNAGVSWGDEGVQLWRGKKPYEKDLNSVLNQGGQLLNDIDLDYRPTFTWERLKGDVSAENLAGYIVEQSGSSIADMAAALTTLPAYVASRTEEIAETRVENTRDKNQVDGTELGKALVPAVASAVLERIGAKGAVNVGGAGSLKESAKRVVGAAKREAGTEFVQEQSDYAGETLDTDKDWSAVESVDRGLAGAVAGGGTGAVVNVGAQTAVATGLLPRTPEKIEEEIKARKQRKAQSTEDLESEIEAEILKMNQEASYVQSLEAARQQINPNFDVVLPLDSTSMPETSAPQEGTVDYTPYAQDMQSLEASREKPAENGIEFERVALPQENILKLLPKESQSAGVAYEPPSQLEAKSRALEERIARNERENDNRSLDREAEFQTANTLVDGLPEVEAVKKVEAQGLSARFSNRRYRSAVKSLARELVPGGDVSYQRDTRGSINGRTSSVNPEWFQNSEDLASVNYVRQAVYKALQGEKLGPRQQRAIESLMDVYEVENGLDRESVELTERYHGEGVFDPVDDRSWYDEKGRFRFDPADSHGPRTYAMLEEEALKAGVSHETLTQLIAQQLPLKQHAEALYEQIQKAGVQGTHTGGDQSRAGALSRRARAQEGGAQQADNGATATDTQRPEPEGLTSTDKEIETAAREAATSPHNNLPEPTDAQKEAGNYKVGKVKLHGLELSIENPRGSVRSGTSLNGKRWENTLPHHYGYIRKTEGADGDHVDVFVGPDVDSERVFVLDQVNEDGSFDEHKVLLGFSDKAKAIAGYKGAYDKGWKVGPVTAMDMPAFKTWLKGDTKQPLAGTLRKSSQETGVDKAAKPPEKQFKTTESKADFKPVSSHADTPKKDLKGGPYSVNFHNHLSKQLRTGKASIQEFQAGLKALLDNLEEVTSRLNQYKKSQLMNMAGFRWKVDLKKPELVGAVKKRLLSLYLLDRNAPSLTFGVGDDPAQAEREQWQKTVDIARSTSAEDLQRFAESRQQAERENKEAEAKLSQQLESPKNLEDYRALVLHRGEDQLTDGQLAEYDRLRTQVEAKQRVQLVKERSQVSAQMEGSVAYETIDTTHTKKGHDLYVVKLTGERLPREEYHKLNKVAKQLGGYYSNYRGNGAVPGFQFNSEEARADFLKVIGGEAVDNAVRVEERQQRKLKKRTTKVAELADRLEATGEAALQVERKENTTRRAAMAAHADARARAQIDESRLLRRIAKAAEAGNAPVLSRLSTMTQLNELQGVFGQAYHAYVRSLPDTEKRTNNKGVSEPLKPADINAVVRHAKMPEVIAHVSPLKWLAEDMQQRKGFVQTGRRLQKAVDTLRGREKSFGPLKPLLGHQWEETLVKLREYADRFGSDGHHSAPNILDQVRQGGRLGRMGIEDLHQLRQALRELDVVEQGTEKKKANRLKELERSLVGRKGVGIDFNPTPPKLAKRVIDEADIQTGMEVLEPSAGHGALADAARDAGANVDTVEQSSNLREILEEKGHTLVGRDFMQLDSQKRYDRIVMNPPFSKGQDADHVRHAYQFLKPGGRLVAITGRGIHFRSDSKAQGFRKWLEDLESTVSELPSGSFKDSLNSTGVETNLVVIEKPEEDVDTFVNSAKAQDTEKSAALYSLGTGKGIKPELAKAALSRIKQSVGVDAKVVADESGLPAALRQQIEADGVSGQVRGLYHAESGSAYIVAGNLNHPADAARVYLHEVIGHKGIRATLKKRLDPVLTEIYRDMPMDVRDTLQSKYHSQLKGLSGPEARRRLADEYVAHLAENDSHNTLLRNIIAIVRRWLRQVGFNSRWTEADIVELLARGKRALRRGADGKGKEHGVRYATKRRANDYVVALWKLLAGHDDLFRVPPSDAKNLADILRETDTGIRLENVAEGNSTRGKEVMRHWLLKVPQQKQGKDGKTLYKPVEVLENGDGEVWINVSRLDAGLGGGQNIYAVVGNYAHNNGKVFIGDPEGLSDAAMLRRTEHMLSSALKFGSTRHVHPHPRQEHPDDGMEWVQPLRFGDSDTENLRRLLEASYHNVSSLLPEIEYVRYSFENGRFEFARSFAGKVGEREHRGRAGDAVPDRFFNGLADESVGRYRQRVRALGASAFRTRGPENLGRQIFGSTSLKRAALTSAFMGASDQKAWGLALASISQKLPRPLVRLQYSLSDPATDEALARLGLGKSEARGIRRLINRFQTANFRQAWTSAKARTYEGTFDGLVGIQRAEEAVGKGIAAGDFAGSGYVGARLASGIADVMFHILHKGGLEWKEGVTQYRQGTQGLLDIFKALGPDLNDWLGWMGGNRARELMLQGREKNLSKRDIAELLVLNRGREARFLEAKRAYSALNRAMLDLAQEAGLIDPKSRRKWASEWYIPFYRQELDGNGLLAPRTKRGLSHQSAGIKALKGGATSTNDLLQNILTNWMKLADAAMKNRALLKTVDNLKGTDYLSDESLKYTAAIVPRSEVVKRIKADRAYLEMMADQLGLPEAGELEVLHELNQLDSSGFEKLWAITAPTDPEVIRVQRNGRNTYYRVNDPALLRGLVHLSDNGINWMPIRAARGFKRLLTTGVTASPDFMLRNLVRDAAHAWAINKDGFVFGKDTVAGITAAAKEDEEFWAMTATNASFQGGYVHGGDPEEGAQMIRRALKKKGLSRTEIDNHMDSVIDVGEAGWSKVQQAWQWYREKGDKLENSNRLATYKAALEAGKSKAQAAFEAKDLMDYSLRGNWAAMNVLTDVVPFLNARLQGLSKLIRAGELKGELHKPWTWRMDPLVGMAVAKIALVSSALALWNDDDEHYQSLPDWEKDAYWHIFMGDHHLRVPKPFEIGILAGTIPERMMHTWILDNQPDEKLLWSMKHGLLETLGFNITPQMLLPAVELYANRSFHFDKPIESLGDQRKLPKDRYNSFTSDTMVSLAQVVGWSPKQMEHFWVGYTGTMGAYALSVSDMLVSLAQGKPNQGEFLATDIPVLKSFYRGTRPPYSTQYTNDLYERLKEVSQLAASLKELRGRERAEFITEHRNKLAQRRPLNQASRHLSELRKRRERILAEDVSRKAKQLKLDVIQEKVNAVAARASQRSEAVF
ncbi:LPD38 domain-containing protein [Microbulbifer sp. 2304DJ12-6]|uniref:LPD38 domain-containing protein n=1 Tax=Microbulbifer sp. 2304DJ12-6 TaxID=3233340 RepID=UPI0039B11B6D